MTVDPKSRLQVKVCGMRTPGNIGSVLETKPDYIGLIFVPTSKRFVELTRHSAENIKRVVQSRAKLVGVFQNQPVELIHAHISEYRLDVVQLHGEESPDYCAALKAGLEECQVWKAIKVSERRSLEKIESFRSTCSSLVLDSDEGGSGKKFDWQILAGLNLPPYFLGGGLGLDDIWRVRQFAAGNPRCIGVDINSRFEIEPGLKDVRQIAKFIDEVRT